VARTKEFNVNTMPKSIKRDPYWDDYVISTLLFWR